MTLEFTLLDGRVFHCAPDDVLVVTGDQAETWQQMRADAVAHAVATQTGSGYWGWPAVSKTPVEGKDIAGVPEGTVPEGAYAWCYGFLLTNGVLGLDADGQQVLYVDTPDGDVVDVKLHMPAFDDEYVGPMLPGISRRAESDDMIWLDSMLWSLLRIVRSQRRVPEAWFHGTTTLRFLLLQGMLDGCGHVVDTAYKCSWKVIVKLPHNPELLSDVHRLALEYGFEVTPRNLARSHDSVVDGGSWWDGCVDAAMWINMDHRDKVRMFTRPDVHNALILSRDAPQERRVHQVRILHVNTIGTIDTAVVAN